MSAFGIDHEPLSKSMVTPGVYKPAKLLAGTERSGLRASIATAKKGVSDDVFGGNQRLNRTTRRPLGSAPSAQSGGGRKIWGGKVGETRSLGTKVKIADSDEVVAHPTDADKFKRGSAQANGRGGGLITLHPKTPKFAEKRDAVIRHEKAHLAPKRNPVRWQERRKDPVRVGREEGRADFVAHGKATTGLYPGSPEFRSGYNEVQTKMAAAQKRRVSKSYAKLGPKLRRVADQQAWGPEMQQRMRANYVVARIQQGENKSKAKYSKEFANASATAVQNMNRRKKKVLP